jgi:hypothetical protein
MNGNPCQTKEGRATFFLAYPLTFVLHPVSAYNRCVWRPIQTSGLLWQSALPRTTSCATRLIRQRYNLLGHSLLLDLLSSTGQRVISSITVPLDVIREYWCPMHAHCISTLNNVLPLLQKRADRAAAQESATTFSTEPLNWFEQQRADNIARNRSMLAKLTFPLAAPAATATASVDIAVQGGHAAGKEIRLARDSKGRFIGSAGSSEWRRKHAKIDSEQCTSSGVRLPTTVKSSSDGSVVIVPVVEGSLAVACDMATWAQKCNVSMQAPSIPHGEDLNGCTTSSNEQAALSCIVAGRASERLPEASTGGQMEAPQASAEALANLGCEIWLAGIPSEAVRENLFGVSKAKNWKKKRRLNAELQPAT